MKNWLLFFSIFLSNILLLHFCPWWVTFACSLILSIAFSTKVTYDKSFINGFSGGFLAWLLLILLKDIPNEHLLSGKIAQLFSMPNYVMLIVLNAFVGGITSGLGAWLGKSISSISFK